MILSPHPYHSSRKCLINEVLAERESASSIIEDFAPAPQKEQQFELL